MIGGGGPYRGGSGLAPGSSLMGRGPHPPATNIHHMGQGGMVSYAYIDTLGVIY